jgi:hypothetical protein
MLYQRCSIILALLHGVRKLPRDVLQACYNATETVMTGLCRDRQGRKRSALAVTH